MRLKLVLRFLFACVLVLMIGGCFPFSKSKNLTNNYALFAELDDPILYAIQKAVSSSIDAIIQQELGVNRNAEIQYFMPKKRFHVTLYYIDGLKAGNEHSIVQAIDRLQDDGALSAFASTITSRGAFFGDAQEELVLKVGDMNGSLRALHEALQQAMVQANSNFKQQYQSDLYDKVKSEQFPYVPHITLGKLQIKELQKCAHGDGMIIQRIKQRIEDEVHSLIESLHSSKQRQISISNVCIYDLQKRDCIKRYLMEH